jgi:hypothetical protein
MMDNKLPDKSSEPKHVMSPQPTAVPHQKGCACVKCQPTINHDAVIDEAHEEKS